MPDIEVAVREPLVRALLGALPERLHHLRSAPVRFVATGWDNAVWRVGESYALRIPVRAQAAPLLENEAAWAAVVSAPLREKGIRVPTPVHHGVTPELHPWSWLLVEWVPGELVSRVAPAARGAVAESLAQVLPALHRPAPPDAPVSPARGVPLAARRAMLVGASEQARRHLGDTTASALLTIVEQAISAPAWPRPSVWCHGDLHDDNMVLNTSTHPPTVGILDFGDLTRGDPAVDLRVLWTTFEATDREGAVQRLAASDAYDDAVWVRARGWAAAFVLGVAGDDGGRADFAATITHARAQLGCA